MRSIVLSLVALISLALFSIPGVAGELHVQRNVSDMLKDMCLWLPDEACLSGSWVYIEILNDTEDLFFVNSQNSAAVMIQSGEQETVKAMYPRKRTMVYPKVCEQWPGLMDEIFYRVYERQDPRIAGIVSLRDLPGLHTCRAGLQLEVRSEPQGELAVLCGVRIALCNTLPHQFRH